MSGIDNLTETAGGLPAVSEFTLRRWDETFGTDFYGALHVAADYCGFRDIPPYFPGAWQHGVMPPWELQPGWALVTVDRCDELDEDAQRACGQLVVDGIEHQHVVGIADMVEQVHALRAAVDHRDLGRHLPAMVQCLDGPHAEALVGPQHVADAQHQHRRRGCGDGSLLCGRRGAHFLATRQPLIIVLMTVSPEQMSSRTTM